MNKYIKKIFLIGIALAIVFYTLKDISLEDLMQKIGQADFRAVILVGLITLFTYILRAERWRQVLKPLGYSPSLFRATIAVQTGIIASLIVPASGELTRCISLQRTDNVPISHGLGSVIAERVLDIIVLVLMLLLTVLLEFKRMKSFLIEIFSFEFHPLLIILAVVVCTALILVVLKLNARYKNTPKSTWIDYPIVKKILGAGNGLWMGFISLRKLERPVWFIVLTLLNQVMACLVTYVLLQSLEMTQSLPVTATLTILSVISIGGFAVPTQGSIGTYHFLVSRTLLLYGLSLSDGVIIATFMHAVQFLIGILLSGASLLILPLIIPNQNKFAKHKEEMN